MIFLVDNGSVRVDAYKSLCNIAETISGRLREKVTPAPLLHANKIPREELHGLTPKLLEDLIKDAYDLGVREFTVLPLFFGPSGALVEYLPRRFRRLAHQRPGIRLRVLKPLFQTIQNGGDELAAILRDRVLETVGKYQLTGFQVILVDHGSPRPEVIKVRNLLAELLGSLLGQNVLPASMERRKGREYDFNEPLLSGLLNNPSLGAGDYVIAQLFLSPGRHAGPGGDIESICEDATKANNQVQLCLTDLVGSHPRLTDLLFRRWEERGTCPINIYGS